MITVGILPCRYNSTRFPGKPLALIHGYPMMWHTYHRALASGVLDSVFVATDDDRIEDTAKTLGIPVIRTGAHHLTGTDRIAEAAFQSRYDIVVNIQGDEPLVEPTSIARVVERMRLQEDINAASVNAVSIIDKQDVIESANVVKTLIDQHQQILSYSRLPVPYVRGNRPVFFRQVGLYAFTPSALDVFRTTPRGPIEQAEDVEMYRLLEHGRRVLAVEVEQPGPAVDTLEDLATVTSLLAQSR